MKIEKEGNWEVGERTSIKIEGWKEQITNDIEKWCSFVCSCRNK